MNKPTIIRAIAAIAVMLAASINVHAQLGGAVNRAREAAARAVDQTKQTTQQQTQQQQSQPAQPQTAPSAQPQPTAQPSQPSAAAPSVAAQEVKPSAAALAADPRASITTVEPGYTKSPAQIRVAYEELHKETYFFPYYNSKLRRYYLLDDSKAELDFFDNSAKTLDAYRSEGRKQSYFANGTISLMTSARDVKMQSYASFNSAAFSIVDTIPAGNRTPWGCVDDCV